MVAITRILAMHLGQRSVSTPYVLCSSTAHSTRDADAYSSPSSRRRQCSTVIIVGSPEAMATARRSGAPGVAAGAGLSLALAAVAAAGACARGGVVAAPSF